MANFNADAELRKTGTVTIRNKKYEYPLDIPVKLRMRMMLDFDPAKLAKMEKDEDMLGILNLMLDTISSVFTILQPDFDREVLTDYGQEALEKMLELVMSGGQEAPKVKPGPKKKTS